MMMVVVVDSFSDGVCDSVGDDAGAGVCCGEGSGKVRDRLVIEAVGIMLVMVVVSIKLRMVVRGW